MTDLQQYIDKAATLIEALPYIQAFRGKLVVIKYGGSTMGDEDDVDTVLRDIVFMSSVGILPVIVHGGGVAISRRLEEQGIPTRKVNGLRVTDARTMRVVEDVLFGEVNAGIVAAINGMGAHAVAVSAKESAIMHVRQHWAGTDADPVDIGFVGDVERIDPAPILGLTEQAAIPIIAPIGRGDNGDSYNVNADTAAGEIAAALHAEKLVFLTDVKGIMADPTDPDSLLSTVRVADMDRLIDGGVIGGGMLPKVGACVRSVKAGVHKTHIVDGRIPHSMLLEFFTNEGIGTEIIQ
jgi:acetylglutamate kinase